MREVEMRGGSKILILRTGGIVTGLSTKCTHYGAPLVKGVLSSGSLICPFHGACFNALTGDIEDYPGLSSLARYRVEEEGGSVYVKGYTGPEPTRREKYDASTVRVVSDNNIFLVVGGGAAGHAALETLRSEGFSGKIVLVSADSALPYDRPKLSKKLDASAAEIALRGDDWFKDSMIEIKLNTTVERVYAEEKYVMTSSGEKIEYDKLLLATGSTPRQLERPGHNLEGVCTLRTPSQANYLFKQSRDKNVVIIGGSFIGMEVAGALVGTSKRVTVVDRNPVIFQSSFGKEVGTIIWRMHKEKGVEFVMEDSVDCFKGTEGRVTSVVLSSGQELEADLVLVGAGAKPNTQSVSAVPGLLDSGGYVHVDEYMKSGLDSVWAAGDIVKFPLLSYNRELVNIGHWGLSMYLGKVAALNMMGRDQPAVTVPFFWTVQYGKSVRFAGLLKNCDSSRVEAGKDGGFLATYSQAGVVQGVAALGRDPAPAYFSKLIREGISLKEDDAFRILTTMAQ